MSPTSSFSPHPGQGRTPRPGSIQSATFISSSSRISMKPSSSSSDMEEVKEQRRKMIGLSPLGTFSFSGVSNWEAHNTHLRCGDSPTAALAGGRESPPSSPCLHPVPSVLTHRQFSRMNVGFGAACPSSIACAAGPPALDHPAQSPPQPQSPLHPLSPEVQVQSQVSGRSDPCPHCHHWWAVCHADLASVAS